MTARHIRIQQPPFDPAAEQAEMHRGNPRIGALVSFVGLMREMNEASAVRAMTLEHYPGMTDKALAAIADEAAQRWKPDAIRIVHRIGRMLPEEPIVLVAVTSIHRSDAFRACEFLIDYLKTRAPFWKKEETECGARWVEARASDDRSAERWQEQANGGR